VRRGLVLLLFIVVGLASVTAAWAAVDVKQMADNNIVAGALVTCEENAPGNYTREESYYRRFHLPDYGVTGPFTVSSVTFGIDVASDGADAGQPMTVRIDKIPAGSPIQVANLTLDDFEDLTIADGEAGMMKNVLFNRTIGHPNTIDLVLELYIPDGVAAHNRLVFGANETPQTRPTYNRSPACFNFEPTTTKAIGFPKSHLILFATGDEGADVDAPNLKVQIPGGQSLAGALDKGVKAKLSSGEPAGLGVSLLISKRLANQLGIPRVVGTAHSTLAKAGTRTMATDFTRKAKHALHGRHSLSLNVRAKATDDAHNAKTVTKSVTL
jgi:hypothetical protein